MSPAVRLRLLGTSDLHMFVHDYDYHADRQDKTVGLARLATLIAAARNEADQSLLFDNGDVLQGNPLGDYMALPDTLRPLGPARDGSRSGGHPMFRAMNLLGYDAAAFGNHEFDYGLDFLAEGLRSAAFPFVCANLETLSGVPFAPPALVLEREVTDTVERRHRLRIGVIGFVTPQVMVWDRTALAGRLRAIGIVEAARRHVPALRARCDLVVALSHSGISSAGGRGAEENASLSLAAMPGIDVVFTGHAHRVFPGPDHPGGTGIDTVRGTLAGKPAVMPGFWGSHLGIIDLVLRQDPAGAWMVADFTVEARPAYRREGSRTISLAPNDTRVLDAVAPEHAATRHWLEQPVGHTIRPITSYFALTCPEASLSLLNVAQLWYAKPLLAGTAHAGLPLLSAASSPRTGGLGPDGFVDIQAGPLALRDIAGLALFANTLCVVRCRGDEIREWLERACAVFERIDPAIAAPQTLLAAGTPGTLFDVLSGLTYGIDLSQPARYGPDGRLRDRSAARIAELRHRGAPIDPAQEFAVVTNDFRANGGGNFPATGRDRVILATHDLTRDVLRHYVLQHQPLDPAPEPVWHFVRQAGPVLLAFDGNAHTARHLAEHPGITRLGAGAGGYVRYGLALPASG